MAMEVADAEEDEEVDAGTEVAVECLADGGYVVELQGARFVVSGAGLDGGGAMTAIVDGRRAWEEDLCCLLLS